MIRAELSSNHQDIALEKGNNGLAEGLSRKESGRTPKLVLDHQIFASPNPSGGLFLSTYGAKIQAIIVKSHWLRHGDSIQNGKSIEGEYSGITDEKRNETKREIGVMCRELGILQEEDIIVDISQQFGAIIQRRVDQAKNYVNGKNEE